MTTGERLTTPLGTVRGASELALRRRGWAVVAAPPLLRVGATLRPMFPSGNLSSVALLPYRQELDTRTDVVPSSAGLRRSPRRCRRLGEGAEPCRIEAPARARSVPDSHTVELLRVAVDVVPGNTENGSRICCVD
jgi:hypothetical protein